MGMFKTCLVVFGVTVSFFVIMVVAVAIAVTNKSSRLKALNDSAFAADNQIVEQALAQKLKSWNTAKAELDELKTRKPVSPVFEECDWVTKDERFRTSATIEKVDAKTVTLRKSNGKTVIVKRDLLNEDSNKKATKALLDLFRFDGELRVWEKQVRELQIKSSDSSKPTRESVISELENEKRLLEQTALARKRAEEAEETTKRAKEAAERAKRAKKEEAFYADGSHGNLVQLVKHSMHNPKSFEHVKTAMVDVGTQHFLQMRYRGTNGFGGIVTQTASAILNDDWEIIKWEIE